MTPVYLTLPLSLVSTKEHFQQEKSNAFPLLQYGLAKEDPTGTYQEALRGRCSELHRKAGKLLDKPECREWSGFIKVYLTNPLEKDFNCLAKSNLWFKEAVDLLALLQSAIMILTAWVRMGHHPNLLKASHLAQHCDMNFARFPWMLNEHREQGIEREEGWDVGIDSCKAQPKDQLLRWRSFSGANTRNFPGEQWQNVGEGAPSSLNLAATSITSHMTMLIQPPPIQRAAQKGKWEIFAMSYKDSPLKFYLVGKKNKEDLEDLNLKYYDQGRKQILHCDREIPILREWEGDETRTNKSTASDLMHKNNASQSKRIANTSPKAIPPKPSPVVPDHHNPENSISMTEEPTQIPTPPTITASITQSNSYTEPQGVEAMNVDKDKGEQLLTQFNAMAAPTAVKFANRDKARILATTYNGAANDGDILKMTRGSHSNYLTLTRQPDLLIERWQNGEPLDHSSPALMQCLEVQLLH
ncbi:hypothetical protein BDP27DRAFT_1371334 [Rhodocollybia butyracea]|uniref:Uncharacterized protein n=1 Tax=Rhodocollybia butyracea TaxID=206335 RepID=A0A9P5PA24_9AGAR|nr:hypothetical protein BDP27DRAFT_1371334 [Rhodocollybia butyracea]